MRSDWLFVVLRAYDYLTDNSLKSADKDQQESRASGRETARCRCKIRYVYGNLQRHRAVLPAIAWLSYIFFAT